MYFLLLSIGGGNRIYFREWTRINSIDYTIRIKGDGDM